MNLIAQKEHSVERRTSLSPLWTAVRDDLRTRRVARASREDLARDLASYTTPAEQDELDAILDRAEPHAAAEIRGLIHRNRVA